MFVCTLAWGRGIPGASGCVSRTLRPPRDGVASSLPLHLIMPQGEVLEVTEADGGQRCPPRVNASSTGEQGCEARPSCHRLATTSSVRLTGRRYLCGPVSEAACPGGQNAHAYATPAVWAGRLNLSLSVLKRCPVQLVLLPLFLVGWLPAIAGADPTPRPAGEAFELRGFVTCAGLQDAPSQPPGFRYNLTITTDFVRWKLLLTDNSFSVPTGRFRHLLAGSDGTYCYSYSFFNDDPTDFVSMPRQERAEATIYPWIGDHPDDLIGFALRSFALPDWRAHLACISPLFQRPPTGISNYFKVNLTRSVDLPGFPQRAVYSSPGYFLSATNILSYPAPYNHGFIVGEYTVEQWLQLGSRHIPKVVKYTGFHPKPEALQASDLRRDFEVYAGLTNATTTVAPSFLPEIRHPLRVRDYRFSEPEVSLEFVEYVLGATERWPAVTDPVLVKAFKQKRDKYQFDRQLVTQQPRLPRAVSLAILLLLLVAPLCVFVGRKLRAQ